jgi:hypothetical protein
MALVPGLVRWYNHKLARAPYTTKAVGTGLTYFCSDLTAQAIEGAPKPLEERAGRALKFSAVGGLWVGPLLTAWFNVMDRFVPGRGVRPVAVKLVVDQVVQGPLMIGSMFALCAGLNGASPDAIRQKLDDELFDTWVNSVYVWSPVQVVQQVFVPLQYRVVVSNAVSYVWDTYLSLRMMPAPAEAGAAASPKVAPLQRRRTIVGPC